MHAQIEDREKKKINASPWLRELAFGSHSESNPNSATRLLWNVERVTECLQVSVSQSLKWRWLKHVFCEVAILVCEGMAADFSVQDKS